MAGSLYTYTDTSDLETPENQGGREREEWAVPVLLAYSPFLTHQGQRGIRFLHRAKESLLRLPLPVFAVSRETTAFRYTYF